VGLGLAGGLTPSPSALLLVLGATAAGHAWAGVAAVVAFGVGMSATLTGVGLLAGVTGERLLSRAAPLSARAPQVAGVAIVVAGVLMSVRGAWAL
jgi:ABC-type nickel/cobalt efflux system permease component RcnA